jgi:hypothetical protein
VRTTQELTLCFARRMVVNCLYSGDHPDVPILPLKTRHLDTVRQLSFLTTQPAVLLRPRKSISTSGSRTNHLPCHLGSVTPSIMGLCP